MFRSPIRRQRGGDYRFTISDDERQLVLDLVRQLRELLTTDSPALRRLFPPPYGDDDERNAGYAVLAGSELVERRLAALEVIETTIDAETLTEDQLQTWMRSVNDLRLVLGTLLDISDDEQPVSGADETMVAVYEYLGQLLELTVQALTD
ncbi:MAG: DUF2017 family protein [Microthrixaceae bacterium]